MSAQDHHKTQRSKEKIRMLLFASHSLAKHGFRIDSNANMKYVRFVLIALITRTSQSQSRESVVEEVSRSEPESLEDNRLLLGLVPRGGPPVPPTYSPHFKEWAFNERQQDFENYYETDYYPQQSKPKWMSSKGTHKGKGKGMSWKGGHKSKKNVKDKGKSEFWKGGKGMKMGSSYENPHTWKGQPQLTTWAKGKGNTSFDMNKMMGSGKWTKWKNMWSGTKGKGGKGGGAKWISKGKWKGKGGIVNVPTIPPATTSPTIASTTPPTLTFRPTQAPVTTSPTPPPVAVPTRAPVTGPPDTSPPTQSPVGGQPDPSSMPTTFAPSLSPSQYPSAYPSDLPSGA